jgi:hypothetical protein
MPEREINGGTFVKDSQAFAQYHSIPFYLGKKYPSDCNRSVWCDIRTTQNIMDRKHRLSSRKEGT